MNVERTTKGYLKVHNEMNVPDEKKMDVVCEDLKKLKPLMGKLVYLKSDDYRFMDGSYDIAIPFFVSSDIETNDNFEDFSVQFRCAHPNRTFIMPVMPLHEFVSIAELCEGNNKNLINS